LFPSQLCQKRRTMLRDDARRLGRETIVANSLRGWR
jgi:hypothetical protein